MNVPLSEAGDAAVQGTLIDASGWVLLVGSILLTALWLYSLVK